MSSDQAVKTPDLESLCERLTDGFDVPTLWHGGTNANIDAADALMREAASAISSLQARITELEGENERAVYALTQAREAHGATFRNAAGWQDRAEAAESRALLAEAQVREAVEVFGPHIPKITHDMHGGYGRCNGTGQVWVQDHEQSNNYRGGSCPDCLKPNRAQALLQRLKSPSLEGAPE